MEAMLNSIAPCLLVVFLCAPGVNRAIFRVWDCEPYEFSPNRQRYYMRASLSIECDGDEYDQIRTIVFPLIALWPVGSVVLFAALSRHARGRLLAHTYDRFVRATRFLHNDFRPEYCAPPTVLRIVMHIPRGATSAAQHGQAHD